jgi:uncharacterized protein (TIGR02001 family)
MRDHCARRRSMHLLMFFHHRHASQTQPLIRRAGVVRAACAAAAMLAVHPAQAQLGASLALASDYSARGISLSRGHPSLQLRVDYDAAPGWYGGAFATPEASPDGEGDGQLIGYAGYARRLPSGLSWDAGVTRVVFLHDAEYNYHEVYAGVSLDHVGARLSLSPRYYGGRRTAYGEVNGFYPLREHLRLTAHVGVLYGLGGEGDRFHDRVDVRLALAGEVGDCNLQLAWVASQPRPGGALKPAQALSVSATYSF